MSYFHANWAFKFLRTFLLAVLLVILLMKMPLPTHLIRSESLPIQRFVDVGALEIPSTVPSPVNVGDEGDVEEEEGDEKEEEEDGEDVRTTPGVNVIFEKETVSPQEQKQTKKKIPSSQAKECTRDQRLDMIKSSCERSRISYNATLFKDAKHFARFFVVGSEKKIYCGVQSTGSSSWRGVIDAALELKEGDTFNPQLVAQKQHLREKGIGYLSEFSVKEITEMIKGNGYRKILVLKHPLSRFVSAFKTRVQNGPLWKLKKLKKVLEERYAMKIEGYNITLSQFAKFVTREDPVDADRFWQSFQALCFPCTVRFDDVIKGELHNLELDDDTAEQEEAAKRVSSARPLTVLEELTPRELSEVLAHYNTDMSMFGYGWKSAKATCDLTPTGSSEGCC